MVSEVKKSWFRQHWIITSILGVILGLLILGAIGSMFETDSSKKGSLTLIYEDQNNISTAEEEQSEDTSPIVLDKNIETKKKEDSNLIKKDPMDLLPTREEIDTQWENIKRDNKVIEASGFDSGASLDMDRMESLSLSTTYILVLKFDSKNYADSFYSDTVNKVKESGGYTTISISGIDATCFGYKSGDLYEGYHYTFYCKKENIFFLTEVNTFNVLRSGYSKELAKIVVDKI